MDGPGYLAMDEPEYPATGETDGPQGGNSSIDGIPNFLTGYHDQRRGFFIDPADSGTRNGSVPAGSEHFHPDAASGYDPTDYSESIQSSFQPSVWSRGSARTKSSTAPSHRPGRADNYPEYLADQPPLQASPDNFERLPCEFIAYGPCEKTFSIDDEKAWVKHIRHHLKDRLPQKTMCWFCDKRFKSGQKNDERLATFKERMKHIRKHFKSEYRTPLPTMVQRIRPDFDLLDHMKENKLIGNDMFQRAQTFREHPLIEVAPGDYKPEGVRRREAREEEVYFDQDQENSAMRRAKKKGKGNK